MKYRKDMYEPMNYIDDGIEMETAVGIGASNRLLGKEPTKKSVFSKIADFCSNLNARIKKAIFWKDKPLDIGELKEIPIDYVTEEDLTTLSRDNMNCVKTKGGTVVVTPQSAREIRKNYKGGSVVDSMIK